MDGTRFKVKEIKPFYKSVATWYSVWDVHFKVWRNKTNMYRTKIDAQDWADVLNEMERSKGTQ